MSYSVIHGNVYCGVHGLTGHPATIGCNKDRESVRLSGVKITGSLSMIGPELAGSLDLERSEIGGNVTCKPDATTGQRTVIGQNRQGDSVKLTGATVRGQVNFSGALLSGRLGLQSVRIADDLICRIDSVTGLRMEVGRNHLGESFRLSGAKIGGQVELTAAVLRGDLNLENCEIGGDLLCDSHRGLHTRIGSDDASTCSITACHNLSVGGYAGLINAEVNGTLHMHRVSVGSFLVAHGLCVTGDLELDASTIGGTAQFGGALVCGKWNAPSALFSVGLSFGGSHFLGEHAEPNHFVAGAITLFQATINGDITFCKGLLGSAPSGPQMEPRKRYRIAQLATQDAQTEQELARAWLKAIGAEKRQIRKRRTDESDAGQQARLSNFKRFHMLAVHRVRSATQALEKTRTAFLDAKQKLRDAIDQACRTKSVAEEERESFVTARQNPKELHLAQKAWEAAKDHSIQTPVLDMRHVTVKGSCLFTPKNNSDQLTALNAEPNSVWSSVNLQAAKIGGDFTIHWLHIRGSLTAEDASIDGALSLLGTRIESDLNLRSATVGGEAFGEPLVASQSEAATACPDARGNVILERASFGKLIVSGALPPDELPFFRFSGFRFGELNVDGLSAGAAAPGKGWPWPVIGTMVGLVVGTVLGAWQGGLNTGAFGNLHWSGPLALAYAIILSLVFRWLGCYFLPKDRFLDSKMVLLLEQMGKDTFDEAAYTSVENWLRNRGQDEEADKVYLRMRSREWRAVDSATGRPGLHWRHRMCKWLLLHFAGYGVRPGRVFLFWLLAFGVALALFSSPKSVKFKLAHNSMAVNTNGVAASFLPIHRSAMDESTGTLILSNGASAQFAFTVPGAAAALTNIAVTTNASVTSNILASLPSLLSVTGSLVQSGPITVGFTQRKPRDTNAPGVPRHLGDTNFLTGWARESDTHPSPGQWDGCDAAAMAWRMGLPMIDLFVRDDWVPSSEPLVKWWGWFEPKYESLASVLKVGNWILVSLFLLSVSGLMKTRK